MTIERASSLDGLDVSVDEAQQTAFVHLCGRLSIESSPALRERILALLHRPSPQPVLIDLSHVSYIDCSGLQGRMLHVLEVTGIWALFQSPEEPSASLMAKGL